HEDPWWACCFECSSQKRSQTPGRLNCDLTLGQGVCSADNKGPSGHFIPTGCASAMPLGLQTCATRASSVTRGFVCFSHSKNTLSRANHGASRHHCGQTICCQSNYS